jgi:hypothetical protein
VDTEGIASGHAGAMLSEDGGHDRDAGAPRREEQYDDMLDVDKRGSRRKK